jgi:hypothetical protein
MTDRLTIDALEDLAVHFREVAARDAAPRRRRYRRRNLLLAVSAALALSGTAIAATELLSVGDPVPSDPAAFSADQRPLASTERLSGVQVDDPAGGLPWGVRLARNSAGDPCVTIGRVYRGRIGVLDGGTFRALPRYGAQKCTHFTADRPLALSAATLRSDGQWRTVVNGVASDRIASIDVSVNGAKPVDLVPDKDGAFLLVAEGQPSLSYVVHHRDGTRDILVPGEAPQLGVRD